MPGRIYDISLPLSSSTPQWPTDPRISFETAKSMESGGSSNVTMLHLTTHTGTHVDAPAHMLPRGTRTVDNLDLGVLCGPAEGFAWKEERDVEPSDLPDIDWREVPRLLLRTPNSERLRSGELWTGFPTLSVAAAEALVERGLKLFGVDSLSVDHPVKGLHPVHEVFLKSEVIIVEGLVLAEVPPGRYELICLPLRLEGLDGSPARVVLREID